MTIDELRKSGKIAYEYVRGSHLHNLATETSDVDLGGVYICPEKELLGMPEHYCPEVKNPSNDECFYEFGRWIQLLSSSNPTVLESLFVPDDKIIGEVHPVIRKVIENRDKFLTKAAFKPLVGYAFEQLKKARGLNKKINVDPNIKRKGVLEFCFVPFENGSKPLLEFLTEKGMNQEKIGLAKIDNVTGLYSMYYDLDGTRGYKGVVNSEQTSNEVLCSSIPKGEPIVGYMFFNDAAYRCHCKEYKEYQDWVKHRNPVRYENNLGHNYDAKNMCHVVRLLNMGIELAKTGKFNVVRTDDREMLLDIKHHKWSYDELLQYAQSKKDEFDAAVAESSLPGSIDKEWLNDFLVECRREIYGFKRNN